MHVFGLAKFEEKTLRNLCAIFVLNTTKFRQGSRVYLYLGFVLISSTCQPAASLCVYGAYSIERWVPVPHPYAWTGTLYSTYIGTTAKRVLWYVHYFFSSFKTGFYGYHLGKGDSKLIYALVALYWHFIVSLAHICIFPYTYMFRNIIY